MAGGRRGVARGSVPCGFRLGFLVWRRGAVWCGGAWGRRGVARVSVRCGAVRCGLVGVGLVWCGVVWCGVVWCGVGLCGVWCAVLSYVLMILALR